MIKDLNVILYYADFLSLKSANLPVTDFCKYFFVDGKPLHASYIIGQKPFYDENNKYLRLALDEYELLYNAVGENAVNSFIEDIAMLRAGGAVDAYRMLLAVYQYSPKKERKEAFNRYYKWLKQQKYTHTTFDELGKPIDTGCSRYVYHAEKCLEERGIYKSGKSNSKK